MAILKIARLGHPILQKRAKAVKDISKEDIRGLVEDMSETMIDANGIGLAAPQVGISKQLAVIKIEEENDRYDERVRYMKGVLHNFASMKIDYENSLLEQTFMGKMWMGESSYLAKDELEKLPPDNFYYPEEVE